MTKEVLRAFIQKYSSRRSSLIQNNRTPFASALLSYIHMNLSWSYTFQGRSKNLFVGILFSLVGLGLGIGAAFLHADLLAMAALGFLAFVFFGIGATILIMDLRGASDQHVSNVGGLLGALSFGIPSMFVFPFVYKTDFWLGLLFSVLGVVVTVATIVLYRYQEKTGKAGWSKSWSTEITKDDLS